MKNIHHVPPSLWIDQVLSTQQQNNKENINQLNSRLTTISTDCKVSAVTKHLQQQIPFSQRFKDKLFAINKLGNIYKLDGSENITTKATLALNKTKQNTNPSLRSVFKNKKILINIKRANISSRQSTSSQDTQRETKSLDVSKASSRVSIYNKYRYAADCSQIKEEEFQETMANKPTNRRRISTTVEARNSSRSTVRRAVNFSNVVSYEEPKKPLRPVKEFFTQGNSQKTQNQIKYSNHSEFAIINNSSDGELIKKCEIQLPDVPSRPKESRLPKRHPVNISQKLSKKIDKNSIALPTIPITNKKKTLQVQKQSLLTLR